MNINFERTEKSTVHTHSNVDRSTTTYRSSESTGKVRQNNFALDISGTVMDNSAYFGHGRTAEEVMQEAGQQDITARRNYMAVMSNSMSDEDFARLQRDGFHPGSTEIETVVTIVDHIKTALMKGGTSIVGYTDTLGDKQLEDITGSRTFANELKNQFEKYDIPLTEDNIEAVKEAWRTMEEVQDFPEGSMKYMVENELEPTVENLYLARFSAADDGSRQGRGYYAAGEVNGYYAKKPESIDYEKLMPQIEKVIQEAGFSVDENTLSEARWLIEKGIPLNEDTFSRMHRIKGLSLPESAEDFLQSASAAIADGISPGAADISKKQSFLMQAVTIKEKTEQLDEQTADVILARELPFNLKNLFYIFDEMQKGSSRTSEKTAEGSTAVNLHGRRLLEEVRLSMTVSANLKLLKSGFSIETAPMEELISRLKEAENSYEMALVQETDGQAAKEKSSLYHQTLYTLESIKTAPAAIAAVVSETDTLPEVNEAGKIKESEYKKAGESYEALMTAPRKDMGDSIKKAFQNVDDILADLHKETTEENRKTIRILGYNSMEMTEENFEKVRQSEALLAEVAEKMKPGTVLSMIREGVNPLTMSLEELRTYLNEKAPDTAQELESYSRFLYKLEKKKEISQEERSAFIGIYRLLRQVEKGDDAALGAVMQTGVSPTLQNLLTAVRSSKKRQIDYQINDRFAGVESKRPDVESITDQIEKGYVKTRQDLEEAISDEQTERAQAEFEHSIFEGVRNAAGSEEAVLRLLVDYGQPVTADNLLTAGELLKGSYNGFKKFRELFEENGEAEFETEDFPERLTDSSSAVKAYEDFSGRIQNVLEKIAFSGEKASLDIKDMGIFYKQITFMKSMAREENFEMPVEINGELTAVNLKMIHKNGGESKVAVTLETEALGKCAAEFTYTASGLSGYSICSKKQGTEMMSGNRELFEKRLLKENISAGDIHFITGENLNLQDFSLKLSKDRISGQTPDALYKAAKAYIGFVQEISK